MPPLTTMEVPKYELDQLSVWMVLDIIGGSNTEAVTAETKFIERSNSSTARRA